MKRLIIALVLVLSAAVAPAAFAGKSRNPPCWWVGYDVTLRGDPVLNVGPYCIPCFTVCGLPFPATSPRD